MIVQKIYERFHDRYRVKVKGKADMWLKERQLEHLRIFQEWREQERLQVAHILLELKQIIPV